jgi:parvulin-like peptidyl-prolyl isomerase
VKRITILLILTLFSALLNAQGGDKPIAKIGNISLSEKEFTARYELTPFAGIHDKNLAEAMKKRLLYTLVAEKLFALNAQENKLDTNDIVSYSLKNFEKMFVRDALYKRVVKDKSLALADSLLSVYISYASEYILLSIYSEKQADADKIYNLIKQGTPFNSLYASLKTAGKDTLKLRIGDLEPDKENELLRKRDDDVSVPVYIKDGWYICRIIKRNDPVVAKMQGWEQEYKQLQKTAAERAEGQVYKNFMLGFFGNKKINASSPLLKSFASKIFALFEQKNKVRKSQSEEMFLSIPDLLTIEVEFGEDSLKLPYVILDNRNISLLEFLRYFRSESFLSTKYDYNSIASLLSAKTRKFIEQELLTDEGYRQGLQELPEVKTFYNMWKENYLYKIGFSAVVDSVKNEGNTPAPGIIESRPDMFSEVMIEEVITDSLDVVDKVLTELDYGAKMSDLIKKYSKIGYTEPEFIPVESLGERGKIAAGMEIGSVYGPVVTEQGYSVFRVTGKKERYSALNAPVKSNSADKDAEAIEHLIKQTVRLANKYKISVNESMLKDVKRSNINSLIFRNLGFGGRITAVPFVIPFDNWVKEWKENSENIQ